MTVGTKAGNGIAISVRGDVEEILRHLTAVERKIVPGVVASSLTTTVRTVRTRGVARLAVQLGLSTRVFGKRVRVQRASFRRWQARLYANVGRINPAKVARAVQTTSGVTAGRHDYPGAFLARGRGSGVPIILRRATKARLPTFTMQIESETPTRSTFDRLFRRVAPSLWRKTFTARLTTALKKRGHNLTVRNR
jgi:hypothetical protein